MIFDLPTGRGGNAMPRFAVLVHDIFTHSVMRTLTCSARTSMADRVAFAVEHGTVIVSPSLTPTTRAVNSSDREQEVRRQSGIESGIRGESAIASESACLW